MRRIVEERINPTRRHGHLVERFIHVIEMHDNRTISPDQYEDIINFANGHMTIDRLKCCLGKEIYLHGLMGPYQDTIVITLGEYLSDKVEEKFYTNSEGNIVHQHNGHEVEYDEGLGCYINL